MDEKNLAPTAIRFPRTVQHKNQYKWFTQPLKLLWSYYNTHTISKRARGPHNTTWRAVGWTPMLESLFMRAVCPAHLIFLKTYITMNVLTFNLPRAFVFTCPFSTHKPHINNQHVLYFTMQIKGQQKFKYVR
jgi:hypothetical protein